MGCPIQKFPDRSLFSGSPKLIAGYHVFLRLLVPSYPPYTLSNLYFGKIFFFCVQFSKKERVKNIPLKIKQKINYSTYFSKVIYHIYNTNYTLYNIFLGFKK